MAKLNKTMAKKAEAATSGFDPIPAGTYHLRLRDVDSDRQGAAGPYWSWEFEILDEGFTGRRLWNNTSLAENALWKMNETFKAFGAGMDTDTDDLCGMVVRGVVEQRVIEAGSRKGEIGNQIRRLIPNDGFEPEENGGGGGTPDPEDIF